MVHALVISLFIAVGLAAQEPESPIKQVPVDADGFENVTIQEQAKGHYSLTSGETRADLFITDTQLQYKVTKPGFWMEQRADLEELNTAGAKVTRLGDAWSVHILCRQSDRRIFVCTSFNRDGWDRPQEVGGISIGGPSDSIDIRLSRRTAEELLALIQPLFM